MEKYFVVGLLISVVFSHFLATNIPRGIISIRTHFLVSESFRAYLNYMWCMKYILGHNHRAVWKDLGDSFVHTLWADKLHLKSSSWNSSALEEVAAWDQHETSPSWTLLRTNKRHHTLSSKVQLKHMLCHMQTCLIRCMISVFNYIKISD